MDHSKPLTSTEVERLILAYQAMDEIPKIDMVKFADTLGTSKAAAAMIWSRLRAKLQYRRDNNIISVSTDAAQTPKKAPVTPRKTKAAAESEHDDDDKLKTPVTAICKRKTDMADPSINNSGTVATKSPKKKSRVAVKEEEVDVLDRVADNYDSNGEV